MPISWTKANRKKITAIRHPHKADPTDLVFKDAKSAWAWIYNRRAQNAKNQCTIKATTEFAPMLEVLLQEHSKETPPTITDPIHELMRLIIVSHDGDQSEISNALRALVALWMNQAGPSFLVSMLDTEASFSFLGSYSGSKSALSIEPVEPNPHGHKSATRILNGGSFYYETPFWMVLRAWLFAASSETYKEAVAAFTPRREALLQKKTSRDPHQADREQSYLSYAFSRGPIWATEDANAVLTGGARSAEGILLLASLTDVKLALQIAKKVYIADFDLVRYGYDLIESLGEQAGPVLKAVQSTFTRVSSQNKKQLESLNKLAGV